MDGFSVFSVFTLLGGLAFFLYGMNVMSTGLEKLTGGKLEIALKKMTSSKLKSFLLGAGITIAIQSSSAMTVMLVGLVNSGIMQLEQVVGVCFGSDIGTTLTAWILSLAGIEGDNLFLQLLRPESFSPLIALIGIIMIMASKSSKRKDIGSILVGFSILMTGMTFMRDAVEPLAQSPDFQKVLTLFNNPVVGVLVGAAFTGIIQSSAASVGILQAFANTGGLTYSMAYPIIMGLNIGTCATALLSSIGVKKNAKRVSIIHLMIKVIGTLILLPLVMIFQATVGRDFMNSTVNPLGIAIMHTIFNVFITALLMPFSNQLVRLSRFIIKDDKTESPDESAVRGLSLDERLLKTPSVAVEACRSATVEMAKLTKQTIFDAFDVIRQYDPDKADRVTENETLIDRYEDRLNIYLVKIAKSSITSLDSRKVSKMMHMVGNFERISDHAVNLVQSAQEMQTKNVAFSEDCMEELNVILDAISDNLTMAFEAYINDDLNLAHRIEPIEEVVDTLSAELKNRHIRRLQEGECTVQLGYIYQDIITNLERISDHCSNIGGSIIEVEEKTNIHEYLHNIKHNDEKFRREYHELYEKYFGRLAPFPEKAPAGDAP